MLDANTNHLKMRPRRIFFGLLKIKQNDLSSGVRFYPTFATTQLKPTPKLVLKRPKQPFGWGTNTPERHQRFWVMGIYYEDNTIIYSKMVHMLAHLPFTYFHTLVRLDHAPGWVRGPT